MMPTPDPDSGAATAAAFRAGARATGLACACLFVAMLNLTLVVAGLEELVVDELGGSVTDAALYFTVEMVAYLLFAPLWGALSDRFGSGGRSSSAASRRAACSTSPTCGSTGFRCSTRCASCRAGRRSPAGRRRWRYLFDRADDLSRPRLAGFAGASLILGVGLGAPIGGLVTQHWGARRRSPWRECSSSSWRRSRWRSMRPPVGTPGLAWRRSVAPSPRGRACSPWAIYAMERFTVGLFVVVFPLWLLEQHGADPAARGRALAAFLLPFAFLQLGTYRLARRFGPFVLLGLGCAGYAAAFALLGRVGAGPYYPILIALGALAALIFPPTLALTAEWTARETRASALAGFNVAGSSASPSAPSPAPGRTAVWAKGRASPPPSTSPPPPPSPARSRLLLRCSR